jgi:4-hydroxy-tetrahydrodipicolinate synthase
MLTKMAEDIGADAVSVITSVFITPTQDELYEHYATIAKSTELPLLLYNNPARTGLSLSGSLVARLSEIENIIGIKDSSGDLTLTSEFIRMTDEEFSVLSGRDTLILGTLIYGGKGSIAATANVIPKVAVDIYDAFINGNLKRAKEAQNKITLLRMAFNLGTFPSVIKDALELIGIEVGPARLPVRSLSKDKKDKLRNILKTIGAI